MCKSWSVCPQLIYYKYSKWLNNLIRTGLGYAGTQTDSTHPGWSELANNRNTGLLYIPKNSTTGGWPLDQCYIQDTNSGTVWPLCSDPVGLFYSPRQLGYFLPVAEVSELGKKKSICKIDSHLVFHKPDIVPTEHKVTK